VLRLCTINPKTTIEDVRRTLDVLGDIASQTSEITIGRENGSE
jgi:hypothetical protein